MAKTRTAGRVARPPPNGRRNPRRPRPRGLSRSYRVDISDESDDSATDHNDSAPDGVLGGNRTAIDSGSQPNSGRRQDASSAPLRTTRQNTSRALRNSPRNGPSSSKHTRSTGRASKTAAKRSLGSPSQASPRSAKKPRVSRTPVPDAIQGIIPDWQNPAIPYDAWADIFIYAASEGTPDSLDTNWLIHAATTCRLFLEPALAAIYRSPPFRSANKAKRLAALLQRPASETCINYRSKIESLCIEVQTVPQGILYDLIRHLPRLRELLFFTRSDQPPYRELDKNIRWRYSEDVFQALMPSSTQADATFDKPFPTLLKSWEWSGSLIGSYVPDINHISRIHQTDSFAHLTRLSFTNFQVPSLNKRQPKAGDDETVQQMLREDHPFVDSIGKAISEVKGLRHLVFESSTVMNDRLLPLLPRDLVHLELINCWEVRSEDLVPFLRTHGSRLRTLSLLHNQSLDLAYLTNLGDACPNLQELRMNLSYYRHHESLDDGDPLYEVALLPDQVPQWPRALRVIDFEHIRGWSVETAEMFLQSLIDQAEALPLLRRLAIKTILDIPWQARATMRRDWRDKMEMTFLRQYTPPKKNTSLRQFEIKKEVNEEPVVSPKKRRVLEESSQSRRSGRLATSEPTGARDAPGSKSSRHGRSKPMYREPDTDEDEFDVSEDDVYEHISEDGQTHSRGELPEPSQPFIHGLCTTVNIVFDNQKVRELQYGMEDFRSEDDESEEEWDGDLEDDDDVMAF